MGSDRHFCVATSSRSNVCFGSKADIPRRSKMPVVHHAQVPHITKLAMLPRCITLGWRVRLAKMSAEAHVKTKTCPDCNGDGVIEKGTDDEKQCPTCGGSGFVPDDDDDEEVTRTADW